MHASISYIQCQDARGPPPPLLRLFHRTRMLQSAALLNLHRPAIEIPRKLEGTHNLSPKKEAAQNGTLSMGYTYHHVSIKAIASVL
jgi:hypothetical protein